MRVSICVCTCNRVRILSHCLESLTNPKIPAGCEAEILVVDNKSVDNTKEVVDHYSRRSPIKISYFHEPGQGVSTAGNRGIRTVFRDRTVYPYWQNYAYERIIPRVMSVIDAALEKIRRHINDRFAAASQAL